jgi:iron complex outermembrane receptor protein
VNDCRDESFIRRWPCGLRAFRPIATCTLLTFSLLATVPVQAEAELTRLSLEELMAMEITSVAKKGQHLSDAAAAISVISREDIRRSGATSIPELLRQVPGVQVSRIDASRYAVSIRGFSNRFSGKLLVLLDGRTLYTPLFSGVYWEAQDVLLEDVERIEVIRGPGGTLWGADAVNGVINIITRDSGQTQNTHLEARAGTQENGAAARYGGTFGEDGHFRMYAKLDEYNALLTATGGNAYDAWRQGRAGFRADLAPNLQDHITLQGDVYEKNADQKVGISPPPFGFTSFVPNTAKLSGDNLLFRWKRDISEGEDWHFQAYYDRTHMNGIALDQNIDILDLEFQHRLQLMAGHELTWGLDYRHVADELNGTYTLSFTPNKRDTDLYSMFLQYESRLRDDLHLTLGSKFEHNDFSGFEYQPSARLLWQATQTDTFWGAVSRAVHTPSRALNDSRINNLTLGANAFSTQGNPNMLAETLQAWELGYRSQLGPNITLDATAFYNEYNELLSRESVTPFIKTFGNLLAGRTYGVELAASWQITPTWRLRGNYSRLDIDLAAKAGSTDNLSADSIQGSSPKTMMQLHSRHDLGNQVDLDAAIYYMGKLSALPTLPTPTSVDAHTRLDLRLGWHPRHGLELSLTGQNLLDDRHPEYAAQDFIASQIPRGLYGQIKQTF